MSRLCSIWGVEMPAVLEVTQDALMLVNRQMGNVLAANSKYNDLLCVLGCGNSSLGQTVMRSHILEKLEKLPVQEAPFTYEAPIIAIDGTTVFYRGTISANPSSNEVVWGMSSVTELLSVQQQLQALQQSYVHMLTQGLQAVQQQQQQQLQLQQSGGATASDNGTPPGSQPALTAAVGGGIGPAMALGPDWSSWSKPAQKSSEPSKSKTRRPYRFCSKCWLKHSKWSLRSVKLPDGCIINLNQHTNDTCPDWPESDPAPTTAQIRAYGTAFKRAQRGAQLHEIALNEFRALVPNMPKTDLMAYLVD